MLAQREAQREAKLEVLALLRTRLKLKRDPGRGSLIDSWSCGMGDAINELDLLVFETKTRLKPHGPSA